MYSWRRAIPADEDSIRNFIIPREHYVCTLSNKVFEKNGHIAQSIFNARRLYLFADGASIRALVLFAGHSVIPLATDDAASDFTALFRGLAASRFVRACKPGACIGAADHVAALQHALCWKPERSVEYHTMNLSSRSATMLTKAPYQCRRALLSDLDALLPIAEHYEKSEVLTDLHIFDPAASRAQQYKALKQYRVYVAEDNDGRIIARAQTNAVGLACEQIGGVFVVPAYRKQGLGRCVVSALVSDITTRGKSVSLFVKKNNEAALALYRALGFTIIRDYIVSYFC